MRQTKQNGKNSLIWNNIILKKNVFFLIDCVAISRIIKVHHLISKFMALVENFIKLYWTQFQRLKFCLWSFSFNTRQLCFNAIVLDPQNYPSICAAYLEILSTFLIYILQEQRYSLNYVAIEGEFNFDFHLFSFTW